MKRSPSSLSDDALVKMIAETRTTIRNAPKSKAEIGDRVSRFNAFYDALPTKPQAAALIYNDPLSGIPTWMAVGSRLVVGRSPKRSASPLDSILSIQDEEMSRQHFEIMLTDDDLYIVNDLNSLNGTYVDEAMQKSTILIAGSQIRAGKTTFIFTGS